VSYSGESVAALRESCSPGRSRRSADRNEGIQKKVPGNWGSGQRSRRYTILAFL